MRAPVHPGNGGERVDEATNAAPLNYAGYLKLDQLLRLQEPQSSQPDELMFVIVHQASELWFKLLLHELERIQTHFANDEVMGAIAGFGRATRIVQVVVAQFDVVRTMTPTEFSSFRRQLGTASASQSAQFRALECRLGQAGGLDAVSCTHARAEPTNGAAPASLIRAFHAWLASRSRRPPSAASTLEDVPAVIVALYQSERGAAALLEAMIDFDEALQDWRYRHFKIVERMIGSKRGTAGHGTDTLKQSLFHPVFPELWQVRNRL